MKISYILKYKDLIYQFTKREIESRHKGSNLGQSWAILSPLLVLGLYFFIFGLIFSSRFGILKNENYFDFGISLFLGLTIYNIISESISTSPTLIVSQPNYVKKVIFPLEVLSISKIISSFYFSLYSLLIILVLLPFSHSIISIKILILPILLIPLFILCLGISLLLSSLGVLFRDINHITAFLNTLLMYVSAVVYPPSKLPLSLYNILKYNPILILIAEIRNITLYNISINYWHIIYIYTSSIVIYAFSLLIFNKLKIHFPEVL